MKPPDDLSLVLTELAKYDFPSIQEKVNNKEGLLSNLASYLNHLITKDFSKLISLLYRLDISEKKLKELLATHNSTSAGKIIASMIIDRQLQKIETRKKFKPDHNISEEEKW